VLEPAGGADSLHVISLQVLRSSGHTQSMDIDMEDGDRIAAGRVEISWQTAKEGFGHA
jgi:hypothetical protein